MSDMKDTTEYRDFTQQYQQVTAKETDRPLSSHAQLINYLRYIQSVSYTHLTLPTTPYV